MSACRTGVLRAQILFSMFDLFTMYDVNDFVKFLLAFAYLLFTRFIFTEYFLATFSTL